MIAEESRIATRAVFICVQKSYLGALFQQPG
jgi:hypothetical protein